MSRLQYGRYHFFVGSFICLTVSNETQASQKKKKMTITIEFQREKVTVSIGFPKKIINCNNKNKDIFLHVYILREI